MKLNANACGDSGVAGEVIAKVFTDYSVNSILCGFRGLFEKNRPLIF